MRNLKLRIQNQFLYVTIRQSRLKKRTSRRGLNADENALGNQRKPQPLAITPSIPQRKRKNVIPVRSRVSTAIKKATMPATAPSQKTSIGLGNFYAGD